jgi:hypothetical protein
MKNKTNIIAVIAGLLLSTVAAFAQTSGTSFPSVAPTPPLWSTSVLQPPALTSDQLAVKAGNKIARQIIDIFDSPVISIEQKWAQIDALVFANASSLAPQDVVDFLGRRAIPLANAYGAFVTYEYTVNANAAALLAPAPPGLSFTTLTTPVSVTVHGVKLLRYVTLSGAAH